MASLAVWAISRHRPIADIRDNPEGGPEAAQRRMRELVPDTSYELHTTGTWTFVDAPERAVLVSTFGTTTLGRGAIPAGLRRPAGFTTWQLLHQTTSMSWALEVDGPEWSRTVALGPGILEYSVGDPLEFEAGLLPDEGGEVDDAAYTAAAMRWIFGANPFQASADDLVDLGRTALHALTAAG